MKKTMKAAVCALALLGLAIAPLRAADAPKPGTQEAEHFEKQVPVKLDYLLYLPADYGKEQGKKWPLIFFLHGSGERGSDVQKVAVHGPPKLIARNVDSPVKKFIVVSPQCPSASRGWNVFDLEALLTDVLEKYSVDQDRVYLTGLSMGGFGPWEWATRTPERFAAIAPMCGGGNAALARRLKSLPIWVFHGDADPTVPVKNSDNMVEALKAAGADVKYTRYPGVGHDCWTQSYNNPELFDWFLTHKRSESAAAPAGK
jgi:predicted peptidase